MSLLPIQTTRIRAALRSILRAANGREPSDPEIVARANAYLDRPNPRGLGPGDPAPDTEPLFRADDYSPYGPDSPLGGADGRDISRGWAAVREDLDTAGEALTEYERRMAQATSHLRALAARIGSDADGLIGAAQGLQSQVQGLFFGGASGASAAGYGSRIWDVPSGQTPVYPETDAVLLSSNIAAIGTTGSGGTGGGTVAVLRLTASSDTSLLTDENARFFLEQPFAANAGWTFANTSGPVPSLTFSTDGAIGALEITLSPGSVVTGLYSGNAAVTFQSVVDGTSLWIVPSQPLGTSLPVRLEFTGVPSDPLIAASSVTGTVTSIRGHVFALAGQASLVSGPFALLSSANGGALAVSLEAVRAAVPQAATLTHYVSTVSADGPWTLLPAVGSTLALASAGQGEIDLLAAQAVPDALTIGFYSFPLSQAGSLVGAEFSAGQEQAQAEAYQFAWESQGEVSHRVTSADWTSQPGTVKRVAMGAGPLVHGNAPGSGIVAGTYKTSGTCLSRYTDTNGADLTYIALRDTDGSLVLQAGVNYRFSFGVYTSEPAQLTDVPVGIFNPNAPEGAAAGSYALPMTVILNGTSVFETDSFFTDYAEVSSRPEGYGSSAASYAQANATPSRSYQGSGASWPPYCGRMNLSLVSGWNTIQVLLYVPSGSASPLTGSAPTTLNTVLGPSAGIVFGPNLLADPQARYAATGIQQMRGWPTPWTQLSEFDLRFNTPLGQTQVWAWTVDPSTAAIQGVLINHNPSVSETGYPTLDGYTSGQPSTHHLSYLPPPPPPPVIGQAAGDTQFWIRSVLATSDPTSGPLLAGVRFSVN